MVSVLEAGELGPLSIEMSFLLTDVFILLVEVEVEDPSSNEVGMKHSFVLGITVSIADLFSRHSKSGL